MHIEDIQWLDVECGIYFTSETRFLIFSPLLSLRENMKNNQVTTACYFHIVKKRICCLHSEKMTSCERNQSYSMDKTGIENVNVIKSKNLPKSEPQNCTWGC